MIYRAVQLCKNDRTIISFAIRNPYNVHDSALNNDIIVGPNGIAAVDLSFITVPSDAIGARVTTAASPIPRYPKLPVSS